MGEIFAVLSGKGGTGKTSVCAAISTALAQQGRKVLCIDCDIGLRNLDISLGMSDSGACPFWMCLRVATAWSRLPSIPHIPPFLFLQHL